MQRSKRRKLKNTWENQDFDLLIKTIPNDVTIFALKMLSPVTVCALSALNKHWHRVIANHPQLFSIIDGINDVNIRSLELTELRRLITCAGERLTDLRLVHIKTKYSKLTDYEKTECKLENRFSFNPWYRMVLETVAKTKRLVELNQLVLFCQYPLNFYHTLKSCKLRPTMISGWALGVFSNVNDAIYSSFFSYFQKFNCIIDGHDKQGKCSNKCIKETNFVCICIKCGFTECFNCSRSRDDRRVTQCIQCLKSFCSSCDLISHGQQFDKEPRCTSCNHVSIT
jgi:hypothetical protein